MKIAYECDKGWHDLIDRTLELIDSVSKPDNFTITQIKEKFGELRIYYYPANDMIDNIIEFAINESLTICEMCGKKGKLRYFYGWYKTLCNECTIDWMKRYD